MIEENHNLKYALLSYIKLFDKKAYFEAHEILEEAWHPLRKSNHPLKNLVKGLINGAICFEHIKRDRDESIRKATQVLKSYERHKHLCRNDIEFFNEFQECCKRVEELKELHSL